MCYRMAERGREEILPPPPPPPPAQHNPPPLQDKKHPRLAIIGFNMALALALAWPKKQSANTSKISLVLKNPEKP